MAITEATRQQTQPCLGQMVKKLLNDRCSLTLLRFFVAHPNGRFSKLAIVHAIDDNHNKPEVEKALMHMVDEGLLVLNIENEVSFYQLTHEEPTRQSILEMGEFDWRHWQLVLDYI
jgi:DNA-binding transcriptional regulator PaaX